MLNSTPSLFDSFDINKTTISKTTNMKSSLKFMGAFLLFLTFMLTNTSVYSQNKSRTSPSKSSRHSSQKIVNSDFNTSVNNTIEKSFFSPDGGKEIISRRESHAKHFINPDGSYTTMKSTSPLHYQDYDGDWKTYTNNLEQVDNNYGLFHSDIQRYISLEDGTAHMVFDNGENTMNYGLNKGFEIYDANGNLMDLGTLNDYSNSKQNSDNYDLNFSEVSENIDIAHKINRWHLETDYILKSSPVLAESGGFIEFTENFELPSGWEMRYGYGEFSELGWIGKIEITDTKGRVQAIIKEAFCFDDSYSVENATAAQSNYMETDAPYDKEENNFTYGAYSFELINGLYKISLKLRSDWLLDETRQFPVIIDPDVTSTYNGGDVSTCYYSSVSSQSINFNLCNTMNVTAATASWQYVAQGGQYMSEVYTKIGGPGGEQLWYQCGANSGGTCNVSNINCSNLVIGTYASGFDLTLGATRVWGSAGGCNATNYSYVPDGSFTATITYTGCPSLTLELASLDLGTRCSGVTASSSSFTATGEDLSESVTVTAPTGFEVSADNVTFSSTTTVGAAGSGSYLVYVKENSGTSGSFSGNLSCTSSGLTQQVALSATQNATPSGIAASASAGGVCSGESVTLTGSSNSTTQHSADFENGSSSSTDGYSSTSAAGNSAFPATWGYGDPYGYGTNVFILNSDAAGSTNMDETLLSPSFNTSGANSVELTFKEWAISWSYENFDVEVYDGSSWQTVLAREGNGTDSYIESGSNPSSGAFATQTIDISAYANSNMQVRFHYYDANWEYWWVIDDVTVTADGSYSWSSDVGGFISSSKSPTSNTLTENTTYSVVVTSPDGCLSAAATTPVTYDHPSDLDLEIGLATQAGVSVSSGASMRFDQGVTMTATGGGTVNVCYNWDSDLAGASYEGQNWNSGYEWTNTAGQLLLGNDSRTLYLRSKNVNNVTCYSDAKNIIIRKPLTSSSGTLNALSNCEGTASSEESFTATGDYLTGDMTISAPTGYEISTTSGSGFTSSDLTLSPSDGAVSQTVYVRVGSGTSNGSPSGNVTTSTTYNLEGVSTTTTETFAASATVAAPPSITTATDLTAAANTCGETELTITTE